jgi:hypothetical protein
MKLDIAKSKRFFRFMMNICGKIMEKLLRKNNPEILSRRN